MSLREEVELLPTLSDLTQRSGWKQQRMRRAPTSR